MKLGFFLYCYCCLVYCILSLIFFNLFCGYVGPVRLYISWTASPKVLSNFPDNNGSRGIFVSPAVLLVVSVPFIFASFSSLFSKKCLRENDQQLRLQRPPPFHPFAPTREPGGQDCVLSRHPLFMRALQLSRPKWLLQTLQVQPQAVSVDVDAITATISAVITQAVKTAFSPAKLASLLDNNSPTP